MLAHGGERIGLEAGSKPELLAVLARSRTGGIVICNGYKDREYIRLALLGKRLAYACTSWSRSSPNWKWCCRNQKRSVSRRCSACACASPRSRRQVAEHRGEKSKFGLSADEVLRVAESTCAAPNMLDALCLMHFHMGSQIANIQHIQTGLREACATTRRCAMPARRSRP